MRYGAISAPAADAEAVTPSDVTVHPYISLYVGVTGDVAVVTEAGTTVTFVAVPAGAILPIRVRQVLDTGTDADSIVGFKL
jgi:hypothetical protein